MGEQNQIPFGRMPGGAVVEELTLRAGALFCSIITYGGAVRTLTIPDRVGRPVDVVLGCDTLEAYLSQDKFLGALIGRYANRIGNSRFSLNGQEYSLQANDGVNHLHGGPAGFDKQIWTVELLTENIAVLSLFSPDGQQGYPGGLEVQVTYTLTREGLDIDYQAQCNQDTLCNLTNHTYFNLSGHNSGPMTGQYIQILADHYTPTAAGSIPTGAVVHVEGTPMDLRRACPIGAHADDSFEQLTPAGGYDHNWVINGWDGTLRPAARAWSPDTGITLETLTTLPGIQFYSGNYLDGCPAGKDGAPYAKRWGFCLETQYFPDSPNHPGFPSAVLPVGVIYHQRTAYRFGVSDRWPDRF